MLFSVPCKVLSNINDYLAISEVSFLLDLTDRLKLVSPGAHAQQGGRLWVLSIHGPVQSLKGLENGQRNVCGRLAFFTKFANVLLIIFNRSIYYRKKYQL